MSQVFSKVQQRLGYSVDGRSIVIASGENEVADADIDALERNRDFARHKTAGHLLVVRSHVGNTIMHVNPPADPDAAVKTLETVKTDDPRAQLPGESKAKWKARLAAMDDATSTAEADAAFKASWDALTDEERAAMEPTLTDAQRALTKG